MEQCKRRDFHHSIPSAMKPILPNFLVLVFALSASEVAGQNVGIATNAPGFPLDVNGRMRLRHNGSSSGIWFDGSTATLRGFVGMADAEHIGFYGNGGGWSLVMNTTNGRVGVGTQTPTADLDVVGSLRLRLGTPVPGATLQATDLNGNTQWVAPCAFKVNGYSYGQNILFPNGTWTDINFGTNIEYNVGSRYNSTTSEFQAPIGGIYSFSSVLYFNAAGTERRQRLMVRRNGVTTARAYSILDNNILDVLTHTYSSFLDVELLLEAGDFVRIEAYGVDYGGADVFIDGRVGYTWWTGHLVMPL